METSRAGAVRVAINAGRGCAAIAVAAFALSASAAEAAPSYVPGTPQLSTITGTSGNPAPWNEWQGDLGSSSVLNTLNVADPIQVLPTYEPQPLSTTTAYPNVSITGAASPTDSDTSVPYESGTVGTPGPLNGYCGSGDFNAETGQASSLLGIAAGSVPAVSTQPSGVTLPLGPDYFPHVVLNADGSLTGYFDYRPKDEDEAVLAATSTDGGKDWTFNDKALEQNPGVCAASDVNDDGQGHPNVLNFGGTTSNADVTSGGVNNLYTLQRPAGDNAGIGMLVNSLAAATASAPLAGVPAKQSIGIDPDSFDEDSSAVAVPTSGQGVTLNVQNTGTYGEVDALVPGGFVDLGATGTPNAGNSSAADVIQCTGVTASAAPLDTSFGTPSNPEQNTPGQLTGCTAPNASGPITVDPQDLIEQVLGYAAEKSGYKSGTDWTVPAGPNTETADNAVGTNAGKFYVAPTPTAASVGFTYEEDGIQLNVNAPNRVYVNGNTMYCSQSNNNPTTEVENCTSGAGGSQFTAAGGSPILSDPITPAGSEMTTGLVAPDGIIGELPSFPTDGSFAIPNNATYVMYTEKELDYYVAGETNGDVDSTSTTNAAGDPTFGKSGSTAAFDIAFDPWEYLPQDLASAITTSGSGATETFGVGANAVSFTMGDGTTGDYVTLNCTGAAIGSATAVTGTNGSALVSVGSTDWMTGCSIVSATTSDGASVPNGSLAAFYGDDMAKNSMLAAPGAALDNPAQLQQQGEGKAGTASGKYNLYGGAAKLYSNNEDYAVIRVAWTTDGVNFYTDGLQTRGIVSGSDQSSVANTTGSTGSCVADTSYTDLTNPNQQCNPITGGEVNLNAYATPGTTDATEMRWPGSAGTIIDNHGTYEMFMSGAWGGDGDSDAFNQVWYSTSTDGLHWSAPTSVVSTDYSFSASAAQNSTLAGGGDAALGISAYYSGRAYGPSVVPNPNGDGSLLMIFAGYRIPKGAGSVGTVLGTNSADQYTIGNGGNGSDPNAYRNILIDTLLTQSAPIQFSGPSSALYGGSATLTATGGGPSTPVAFTVDSSTAGYGTSSQACSINGTTVSYTALGNCVIDANQAGAGYTAIAQVQQSVKVTPAPLTITASSESSAYGSTPGQITGSPSGLVNGDTAASLTGLSCSTTATSGSSVTAGGYPSTCSGVTDPNYDITYAPGTVTVTPIALTITASSENSVYGSTPGQITASAPGLVNGDTVASLTGLSCSTTVTSSSPVTAGGYPSSCSGLTDPNYTPTYVGGTVTVKPAALTITASSPKIAYGSAVPVITASYDDFVNHDTAASLSTKPSCSTTVTSKSPVGKYPSSCSGATDPNYTISYVPGTVTVVAATSTTTVAIDDSPFDWFGWFGWQPFTTAVIHVTAANVTPTGNVDVYEDGRLVAVAPLFGGEAIAFLPPALWPFSLNSHTVQAVYQGTGNVAGSTSATVKFKS